MENTKEVKSTVAPLIAQAAITFDNKEMGHAPESVRVISLGHGDADGEIRARTLLQVSSLHPNELERMRVLALRAEQLDTGADTCFAPSHPNGNEFWEQGALAFRQDVGLEACPLESGPEQDDWFRGWMATESITFGEVPIGQD